MSLHLGSVALLWVDISRVRKEWVAIVDPCFSSTLINMVASEMLLLAERWHDAVDKRSYMPYHVKLKGLNVAKQRTLLSNETRKL